MNRTIWLTRPLAALVLIAGLIYWRVFALALTAPLTLGGLVVLVYSILSIASIAGLLLRRIWGFYALYCLVPWATIMLSILFIPLPLGFVPHGERWIALTVLNVAVLAVAALAHHWRRADAPRPSRGAA